MRFVMPAVIFLLATPALAQQQPDTADLQRIITSLQSQRNVANDVAITYEVRAGKLAEENAKLKAEIEELKKKVPAKAQ